MKPHFLVVLLSALSLGFVGCPGVPPPTSGEPDAVLACSTDAECGQGAACCGGVCASLASDVQHCGACASGFADCDGLASNGCEVQVASDPANCGACGNACALDNATPSCTAGLCVVDQCVEGFTDCNGGMADGCEIETRSDPAHCGACNHACGDGERCEEGACVTDALYGFGGEVAPLTYSDEVWRFSTLQPRFELVATQGAEKPEARSGHVGAWDTQGNRMIIWGGATATAEALDPAVWALDFDTVPATWSRLTSSDAPGPGGRVSACAGYDSDQRTLYVFGGQSDSSGSMNDLWKFELTTSAWTLVDDGTQAAPEPLLLASCAFQPETRRFVVLGGSTETAIEDGMWSREVDGAGEWQRLSMQSAPRGRLGARFFDGSAPLAVFGGMAPDLVTQSMSFPSDVVALESDLTWEVQRADGLPGGPGGRWGHATAVLNGRHYLFGGTPSFGGTAEDADTVWEFDPASATWTALTADSGSELPAGTVGAVMVAPR